MRKTNCHQRSNTAHRLPLRLAASAALLILVGCGQRGPLTLPTPQFPAPPEQAAPASPPTPRTP